MKNPKPAVGLRATVKIEDSDPKPAASEITYHVVLRNLSSRNVSLHHLHSGLIREESRPPDAAKFILLLMPKIYRDCLIGDLEEEYRSVLHKYGARKARLWYWVQVTWSVMPVLWDQVKKLGSVAAFIKFIH
jgi:hypothetical protein